MELLAVSLAYVLAGAPIVLSMGGRKVSHKRITIHHEQSELRLIRAALRFIQTDPRRPLTFDQDIEAAELVARISAELDKLTEQAQPL